MWPKCGQGRGQRADRGGGSRAPKSMHRLALLAAARQGHISVATAQIALFYRAAKVREFVGSQVLTLTCHPDYITGHTARRPLTRCDFAPSKLLTDERDRASDLGRKPKASTASRFTGKRDHHGSGLFDR
jgi:hypothetical protein